MKINNKIMFPSLQHTLDIFQSKTCFWLILFKYLQSFKNVKLAIARLRQLP